MSTRSPRSTRRLQVVVTGAGGFIGSHLARHLAQSGHTVLGCDNFLTGSPERVPQGIEFVESDCRNLDAMNRLCEDADVVVHCAATAYEGLSVYSPFFVSENVFGASTSVFSAALNQGVSRIVFVSSMARYGEAPVPFDEALPPRPVDPYGVAKVAAEEMLRSLCALHGVEYVVAVPHSVVGAGQRYDDVYRNVAAIMLNRILGGERPIVYGDGTQRRGFTHVADVVEQLATLVDAPGISGEVYNLGSDSEFITINELARQICHRLGVPFQPLHLPPRHGEVRDATCSHAKITALMGRPPSRTLGQALDDLVADIRAGGPLPFFPGLPIEIHKPTVPRPWQSPEKADERAS